MATGLGVTEFFLRFMAWLCLKDNALSGSQICIVTSPRIELAINLIDRMKRMFTLKPNLGITFNTKETVLELNGARIEAFPSHHLDATRGLPNVSFILLDEADFFKINCAIH
jgi:late competence protein required for DNA uptake (superfamily II DNA/RNA helicase)